MTTIQDSSVTSLFSSGNPAADAAKKVALDPQDRFLKLLVTQMQNQDPLNPLDNAEVTSQMAQISTVSGIEKLNDTLKLLLSGYEGTRSLEASSMIGRGVLIPGTSIMLENNAAVAGIELPQSVDKLVVSIKDSTGVTVKNLDLGPRAEGVSSFVWDGVTDSGATAANGNYSFSVSAKQGGNDIPVTTLALGTVNSVSPDKKGAILDVGDLGFVGLSGIKQIF
ncbi:MAG: flagellar hook assembly protein FlgD [Nitrosomonas sp.]|nr:flagellar hook assembly protein FlgD [Nitrosomonas sp.]MDP1950145.1 flagellar hook assembly protein FlgD [Nitrosomonas sp.]